MSIAAQKRRHADIAAHLHDIGQQTFLPKKAALLGDVKIDRGNAAARIGYDDPVEILLGFCAGLEDPKQEKKAA
jgi:hypothetical protein